MKLLHHLIFNLSGYSFLKKYLVKFFCENIAAVSSTTVLVMLGSNFSEYEILHFSDNIGFKKQFNDYTFVNNIIDIV